MNDLRRERLQHEGLLNEKEREAKGLELTCGALIESIRSHLDPYAKIEELEILVAAEVMKKLVQAIKHYHELLGEIRKLKRGLGIG